MGWAKKENNREEDAAKNGGHGQSWPYPAGQREMGVGERKDAGLKPGATIVARGCAINIGP